LPASTFPETIGNRTRKQFADAESPYLPQKKQKKPERFLR